MYDILRFYFKSNHNKLKMTIKNSVSTSKFLKPPVMMTGIYSNLFRTLVGHSDLMKCCWTCLHYLCFVCLFNSVCFITVYFFDMSPYKTFFSFWGKCPLIYKICYYKRMFHLNFLKFLCCMILTGPGFSLNPANICPDKGANSFPPIGGLFIRARSLHEKYQH